MLLLVTKKNKIIFLLGERTTYSVFPQSVSPAHCYVLFVFGMSPVVHFVPIIVALVVLVGQVAPAADNSTALSPITVAPSQYWYLHTLRAIHS